MREVGDEYYKYPKMLMIANAFISREDGSRVSISEADKLVYVVMKTRNSFFDRHFDKQSDIASLCGLTERKVGDSLRKFIEHGIIACSCVKNDGQWKNYEYHRVHCLELVRLGVKKRGENAPPRDETYVGILSESLWDGKKKPKTREKVVEDVEYPDWYFNEERSNLF